ncbi:MAG: hypothetical protein ACYC9J_05340 [Sulfuricaulis sp.]
MLVAITPHSGFLGPILTEEDFIRFDRSTLLAGHFTAFDFSWPPGYGVR